jgi:branched-chain amino acid transport system substrate-binding protein
MKMLFGRNLADFIFLWVPGRWKSVINLLSGRRNHMKHRMSIFGLLFIVAVCLISTGAWAAAVRGVTDKEVKIGCLSDFSGPGKVGGLPAKDSFNNYFAHINAQGGIHGRKIKVVVEDNGIFPNTTLKAARKVIMKDEVFAIGLNLGSSGTAAIVPLCEENQVVLLPYGANLRWYRPGNRWVFVPHTVQYHLACRAVDYFLAQNPKARLGVIYQDDAYGNEGLDGAVDAAKSHGTKILAKAPYKLGTADLSPQMKAMKEANVDAIILWSYLQQAAAAIKIKAQMGWDVPLIGSKPTYTPFIFELLGDLADGYMVSTDDAPLYRKDLPGIQMVWDITEKYGNVKETILNPRYPGPIYMSFYKHCIVTAEGLKRAGRNLTPESMIKGLESIKDFDMGGASPNLTFGPKRHVATFSAVIMKGNAAKKRFDIVGDFKVPKIMK